MDLVEARARDFEAGPRHPWERARLAIVCSLIARHARLKAGDAVLDIGCGDTFVVERLARAYPDVNFYAVDNAFTSDLIDTFRGRLTVRNVSLFTTLDDVPIDRPAALVLLMDVIEHVPDDRAMLGDVMSRRCFGSDTWVVITVPAFQCLFSAHDRLLGHYRRYSVGTLRRLLNRLGLRSVESGYFFASLLPFRMLQALKERLSPSSAKPSTGLSTWSGGERMARALTSALISDGRASLALARAGLPIPGLSVFAVCRKSA